MYVYIYIYIYKPSRVGLSMLTHLFCVYVLSGTGQLPRYCLTVLRKSENDHRNSTEYQKAQSARILERKLPKRFLVPPTIRILSLVTHSHACTKAQIM